MARDFDGSTGYLVRTSAVLTAVPITFSLWVNPDNLAVGFDVMAISDIASINDGFRMAYRSTDSSLSCGVRSGGAFANSIGSNITASAWNHAGAVFASNSSRTVYTNGMAGTPETTAMTPTAANLNRTGIGAYVSSSLIGPTNGKLAEAAIWNAALDAAEMAALAKGFSPILIRPTALVLYCPIVGRNSPEIDFKNNAGMSVSGTAPVADHCRIIIPRRRAA